MILFINKQRRLLKIFKADSENLTEKPSNYGYVLKLSFVSLSSKEPVAEVGTVHRELGFRFSGVMSSAGTGSDFDYFGLDQDDILEVSTVHIV